MQKIHCGTDIRNKYLDSQNTPVSKVNSTKTSFRWSGGDGSKVYTKTAIRNRSLNTSGGKHVNTF